MVSVLKNEPTPLDFARHRRYDPVLAIPRARAGLDADACCGLVSEMTNGFFYPSPGATPNDTISLHKIRETLTESFCGYSDPSHHIRLVGLIFGRPNLPLVSQQLNPNISYWHHHSATHVDFFCVGFSPNTDAFDNDAFEKVVQHFQKETTWRYSGGTDLLLLNARFIPSKKIARLDYSSAITLTLETAIKEGAIDNIAMFFQKIIDHAKTSDGTDPTWGVSDSLGVSLIAKALKKLLLLLLPKGVRDEVRQAFFFAVKDISRARTATP